MPQLPAQTNAAPKGLHYWLGVGERHHLQFLVATFLGWLVVWGASWVLPARYTSSTLILVEQSTMPKNYVVPNVNDDLQQRLQSMTEQILSRSRLLAVINEMKLYVKDQSRLSPDDEVATMRKDIKIDLVKGTNDRISAFTVSYSAADPTVAQEVTNKLTTLFINENLEVRQEASEGTTKFLESQLQTVRQSLEAQEEKIRGFKGQHIGALPAQLESNLQILNGLQSQLQSQEDALNNAKQQRVYLETLVNQYHTLQGSSKGPDGTRVTVASVEQELDKLRRQLVDLSSSYNDQYPEIRILKDKIAATERLRQQLLTNQKASAETNVESSEPANSVPEAMSAGELSLLPQLRSQLRANQTEIKNREQNIATLRGQIDSYRGRLNEEPLREQELADLTRGYDQSKASYDDLLKKKNESAMATSMELLQQGERFRILDPPSLPVKPSFPNRLKFCGLGLLLGIGLGLAVVLALEGMDDRIYDEADFKRLLPVPVVSEIPVIPGPNAGKSERRRIWLGIATAAVILVAILSGSAFTYWKG